MPLWANEDRPVKKSDLRNPSPSAVAAHRNRWQGFSRAQEVLHVLTDISPRAGMGARLGRPAGKRGELSPRGRCASACALLQGGGGVGCLCTGYTGKPNTSCQPAACKETNDSLSRSVSTPMVLFQDCCSKQKKKVL